MVDGSYIVNNVLFIFVTIPAPAQPCRGLMSKGGLFVKQFYETCVVFDATLPEEALAKTQAKIEAVIKENGEFESTDVWGRRELAYEIGRKKIGFYCLFLYAGEGDLNAKIEKVLKMNDAVLRHLTVIRDPKIPLTRPGMSAVAAAMAGKEPAAAVSVQGPEL
jgi:small subunit ribosomal protein S6